MVEGKIDKLYDSLKKAEENYLVGNKRLAKGDFDFVRDNVEEIIYLILAELEE